MNATEQEIIIKISKALPNMSDFDKGYFLGVAENMASEKRINKPEREKVGGGSGQ